jgi:hypothetical protein
MKAQPTTKQLIEMLYERLPELFDRAAAQPAQKKPQNCGTSYCSCVECVMEPAPAPMAHIVGEIDHTGKVWAPAAQPTDHSEQHLDMVKVQPAPVQEPVDTLIQAWQYLDETHGHLLDAGDAEGRMHISVIRGAWEEMDSLVREIWDERGRP